MGHLLGYARVSGTDQNPQLQADELAAAGCWKVFTDTASGALDRRPELAAARARGRKGGRSPALSGEQVVQARRMYDDRELTVEQIAGVLGVGRTSIYRALRAR